MHIDCYGRSPGDANYATPTPVKELARRRSGSTVYIRYGKTSAGPIHRIVRDDDGYCERTWSWGAWSKADKLTYFPLPALADV